MNHNPLGLMTDNELVAMAKSGDDSGFAELMRRHRDTTLKLALSILRDKSDAEDEVQNAWWKAFEHLAQFQGDSKFTTWMTRIVVNQCLMRLRQAKRAQFLYMDEAAGAEETVRLDLPATGPTPEQELGRREVAATLHKEISRIPPLLRNVFMLREMQELPMQEVAERLGISVAAAKSRLLRARLELRGRLEKHTSPRLGAATLTA